MNSLEIKNLMKGWSDGQIEAAEEELNILKDCMTSLLSTLIEKNILTEEEVRDMF